jgi:hypothetical protein
MAEVRINDVIKSLRKVLDQLPETIENAIYKNEKEILRLQRQQIYDGQNNKGEDLHPLYTEDNYFKTQGQARGYIKWKQSITPNPKRNPNAPNLYVNGYVHRNIIIVNENGNIIFDFNSRIGFGEDLKGKYKDLLGLNPTNQLYINNERIIPEIWNLLESV